MKVTFPVRSFVFFCGILAFFCENAWWLVSKTSSANMVNGQKIFHASWEIYMKKDYDSLLGLIVALFLVMGGFYSYVRLDQAEKIWLEPVLQLKALI